MLHGPLIPERFLRPPIRWMRAESSGQPQRGVKPMWLPDWLYEFMPYLCIIAGLATASWDFRKE